MSDQSSSDNTSSVATSMSGTVKSSTLAARAKDPSYTHIFPAPSCGSRPSRKPATKRVETPCLTPPTQFQNENTRLLFGGLQWLLDASVQSSEAKNARIARESSEPLSEKAISSLNARKDEEAGLSSEPAKTAAWIDGQRKSPAAPPF